MKAILIYIFKIIIMSLTHSFGSVYADINENVGEPVFDKFSSPSLITMNASGNSVYVISKNTLMKFDLNPLKKISSVDLANKLIKKNDNSTFTQNVEDSVKRIYVTEDDSKLILLTRDKIVLFDLNKICHLRTVQLQKNIRNLAVLNEDDFVVFDDENRITIFDANTLDLKHSINPYNWTDTGSDVELMLKTAVQVGPYIYISTEGKKPVNSKTLLIDKNNYNLIVTILSYVYEIPSRMEFDFNKIFIGHVREISNATERKKVGGSIELDIDNFNYEYIPDRKAMFGYSNWINLRFDLDFINNKNEYKHGLYLNNSVIFHPDKSLDKRFMINAEDAILINRNKHFQTTAENINVISMKTKDGKLVPINVTTFNKYNVNAHNHREW